MLRSIASPARATAIVALAAAMVGCATPIASSQAASPSRSAMPSPTPSEALTPPDSTQLAPGTMVQVLVGLRVRAEPGTASEVIGGLTPGQRTYVLDGPLDANGYRWYRVSLLHDGASGWIAEGDANGRWLAVVSNAEITVAFGRDIWAIQADESRERMAQLPRGWFPAEPAWSLDGQLLAIGETRQDRELGCIIEGKVAVLDGEGTVIAQTAPPAGTWDTDPIWSSDGSLIAFRREKHTCATIDEQGYADLYVMPARGGPAQLIVANADAAVWSPAGEWIAYVRWNPSQAATPGDLVGPEIWMIHPDGTGERFLGGRADDGQRERLADRIAWAPDGNSITFTRAVGTDLSDTEVDKIDLEGQVTTVLRISDGGIRDLISAPDGGRWFAVEEHHLTAAITSFTAAGADVMEVELSDGVPGLLVMSPDGSTVAWPVMGSPVLRTLSVDGIEGSTYEFPQTNYVAWRVHLSEY